MQKRKLDEQQQQRLLQTTLQETNRLNALCNNMLLSSQIEAGGYRLTNEETNFSELVNGCVQDFVTRFPQHHIASAAVKEDLFVQGDRLLLQMLVNNLIDNAIKYSPKESPVTIVLEEYNNNILLQVKDEGRAFLQKKKENLQQILPVGNAPPRQPRARVGLYLSKKIAGQHNANIS